MEKKAHNSAKHEETNNCVLDFMVKNGIPLLVDLYVRFNYWDRTVDSLEGEELAELEKLIESGVLQVPTPGSERVQ